MRNTSIKLALKAGKKQEHRTLITSAKRNMKHFFSQVAQIQSEHNIQLVDVPYEQNPDNGEIV